MSLGARVERPATIETDRLTLVALLPADIEALVSGDVERAGLLTGVGFPQGWPNDPDARDGLSWHLRAVQADEKQVSWRIRVIVERSSKSVIGSINLKGPPNGDGDVEIGWRLAAKLGLIRTGETRRNLPLWRTGPVG